jgi:hypothetical protein
MQHEIDNQEEALEVIAIYLERLGVEGLRQPHDPEAINKSAVIRYLINEKLQEVLAAPPASTGTKQRVGQGTSKKRKAPSIPVSPTKSRQ